MSLELFPAGRFGVIYADPPWQYKMWSEKGHAKSPEAHYTTMSHEELVAMRGDIMFASEPDSVLFMWAVWPKLQDAMDLMAEWGFTYKTGGAWHKKTKHGKTQFGPGYILRSACEPFILGTRGAPKVKNRSTRNLIEALAREHSRKPDCARQMLENLFDGRYLELFARQAAPNWSAWGNETEKFSGDIDKNFITA